MSTTRKLRLGERPLLEDGDVVGIGLWYALRRRGREGRVLRVLEARGVALGLDAAEEGEDLGVGGAGAGGGGVEKFFGFIPDSQCCDYERGACDVGIATELSADYVFYGGDGASVESCWYFNQAAFREKGSVESDA